MRRDRSAPLQSLAQLALTVDASVEFCSAKLQKQIPDPRSADLRPNPCAIPLAWIQAQSFTHDYADLRVIISNNLRNILFVLDLRPTELYYIFSNYVIIIM
jgi:hypothetical protein